jgi:hypothetical protein
MFVRPDIALAVFSFSRNATLEIANLHVTRFEFLSEESRSLPRVNF